MKHKSSLGYSLVELMIVITIISILASIITPRFGQLTQKAFQSRAKGDLGALRSAIQIYYSETEGMWPLQVYGELDDYYTKGASLSTTLCPKYMEQVPVPKLMDQMTSVNDRPGVSFDVMAASKMDMSPPMDVWIRWAPPEFTSMLLSPYVYDNRNGIIYYPNGNYDTTLHYFYEW